MSYATRGSGPASSTNVLQDSGQYYGDKERRQLQSQLPPGKARGKGGATGPSQTRGPEATGPSQTRGPDYRTKPVANDLLKQLLAEPGGIKQMSDAAQYGKLVEMRQRQAMIDRSEGAMREMQRLTQGMTNQQTAALRRARGQAPPGVSNVVRKVVEAQQRQRSDLETAGAQVQSRLPGQNEQGGFVPGGASYLGANPIVMDGTGGGPGVIFRHPKGSGKGRR